MKYRPEMDDTDFSYEQDEVACVVDGQDRLANVVWQGVIAWTYDSGDWSVGIRDGFFGKVESCEVTKVTLWDEDADVMVDATPGQVAQVASQAKVDHDRIIRDNC